MHEYTSTVTQCITRKWITEQNLNWIFQRMWEPQKWTKHFTQKYRRILKHFTLPHTIPTCIPNAPLIPTHAYHTDRQHVNLHHCIIYTIEFSTLFLNMESSKSNMTIKSRLTCCRVYNRVQKVIGAVSDGF